MSFVSRFFVILFSLLFAILAAGIALAIGIMAPELFSVSSDPVEKFMFFAAAFFATSFVGATAFVPAVVLIAIAESFNIRSIFYYALGGGLIAAIPWYAGMPIANILWKMFELFIGGLQAFIFALLTVLYFAMASGGHGDHEEHADHKEKTPELAA